MRQACTQAGHLCSQAELHHICAARVCGGADAAAQLPAAGAAGLAAARVAAAPVCRHAAIPLPRRAVLRICATCQQHAAKDALVTDSHLHGVAAAAAIVVAAHTYMCTCDDSVNHLFCALHAASAKAAPPAGAAAAAPAAAAAAMPPMPPGWKPGDAIPDAYAGQGAGPAPGAAQAAPSWDAITAAPAAAKAPAPAPLAPPPPPAPSSAFDFILNPDLEEVEEAFSSDEEYSDDA